MSSIVVLLCEMGLCHHERVFVHIFSTLSKRMNLVCFFVVLTASVCLLLLSGGNEA